MLNKVLYNDNKKHQLPAMQHREQTSAWSNTIILPFLDKRLRINIASLQQMRKEKEIQEINGIDTSSQIANTLTKLGA